MVYEFCEGGSLANRINQKSMTEIEARRIIVGLSQALDQCYESQVIHRNIMPENIWLGSDGAIKLAGFTLALQGAPHVGVRAAKGTGPVAYSAPSDRESGKYGAR